MKWLFLFSQESTSDVSSYGFVPYKFGPFSFEAQQNVDQTLAQYIEESNSLYKVRCGKEEEVSTIINKIRSSDATILNQVWSVVHCLSHKDLLDRVYAEYPWYTTKSELLEHDVQIDAELAVYTSGYEGKSVDAFLNDLLQQGIRGILDVRCHAYSHKYGLSGPALNSICNKLGIQYDHLPALGVASKLRKDLSGPDAFKKLFDDYETHLSEKSEALAVAAKIVKQRPTSLMCFEAKSECCHRGRLAPNLASLVNLTVKHL